MMMMVIKCHEWEWDEPCESPHDQDDDEDAASNEDDSYDSSGTCGTKRW